MSRYVLFSCWLNKREEPKFLPVFLDTKASYSSLANESQISPGKESK